MDNKNKNLIKDLPSQFIDDIRYHFRVLLSSIDRFYWDDGFSKAASLAYTSLFALVPFTTLVFAQVTSFSSLASTLPEVQNFIFHQFIPNSIDVTKVLEYVNNFSTILTSLNFIAIPFLVITSILLLNSIEFALNRVWQVYEPRTVAQRILIFCAILVLLPILAVSAYYTTQFSIEPFINNFSVPTDRIVKMYRLLLAGLIDLVAFTSLYYLVPKATVTFRAAAKGGFISAVLFNFAKNQFAFYVASFTSYEKIYGTLAAIPLFLLWLYFAWVIVLFGAEISFQAQYLPRTGQIWKRALLSIGDARIMLALQSLIIIAKAFQAAEPLPNEIVLSEKLGCSSIVLKSVLEDLKKAGFISRGDSSDMPLTLIRSPEKITINEIIEAVSPQNNFDTLIKELSSAFVFIKEGRNETLKVIIESC